MKAKKVRDYNTKWKTATSKQKASLMDILKFWMMQYVQKVGYGEFITDKNHPGFGKALRETSIEDLTETYFESYGDELSREQIEEVATHVFNIEYHKAYRDEEGEWVFPKNRQR